jgi:hypothetical protein
VSIKESGPPKMLMLVRYLPDLDAWVQRACAVVCRAAPSNFLVNLNPYPFVPMGVPTVGSYGPKGYLALKKRLPSLKQW